MNPKKHVSLNTMMIVITVVAIVLGVWQWHLRADVQKKSYGYHGADLSRADAEAAIEHAAGCERAIIHVHIDWSMYAIQHKRFTEFMMKHVEGNPNSNLMFHYVDCTNLGIDYSVFSTLEGWDERGRAISGCGEVIWLENGRVVKVSSMAEINFSISELTQVTNEVFPPRREN